MDQKITIPGYQTSGGEYTADAIEVSRRSEGIWLRQGPDVILLAPQQVDALTRFIAESR